MDNEERILEELRLIKAELKAVAPKKWLDVKEACEYINIGKTKMYQLLEDREISYSTIGDKMLIKTEELERFMKFQEVQAKTKKAR